MAAKESVAVALTAAVCALSAAAPASATMYHQTWSYLHFPARSADAVSVTPRTLTLNGTYRWRAFSAHWAHQNRPTEMSRTVRLKGRYRWWDGFWVSGGKYRHYSALVNERTHKRVSMGYAQGARFGDGSYHWGSTLNHVCAR